MPNAKLAVVLVHGLWADGSSWSELIPLLQADGYEVGAVQLPLSSLEDDVAAVRRTLDRLDRPVVLVGHSYGGFVITAAGTDERVKALVYVAALGPDVGETGASLGADFDPAPLFGELSVVDGHLWINKEGIANFCGDLSDEQQALIHATQGPANATLFSAKLDGEPAWKSKPSWYIVASADGAINPEQERFMARRMQASTIELNSSHVPMISQPDVVFGVIREALTVFG